MHYTIEQVQNKNNMLLNFMYEDSQPIKFATDLIFDSKEKASEYIKSVLNKKSYRQSR